MNDIIRGAENIAAFICRQNIRGIIFDIDGTLLDSMPVWDDLGSRYLGSLGIVPEPDVGKILFPMTVAEGIRYLKTAYSLQQSEAEIRGGLRAVIAGFYSEKVQAKPGAEKLVRALHAAGIPMILATVGERDLETAALSRTGLLGYFRDMLFCEDYKTTKRDPKIYRICADALGTRPEETLVVEDTLQAIRTACRAGFRTAAVNDAASESDREAILRLADYDLDHFELLCSLRQCRDPR